jgi:(E)-4-hydroxy-3-methylbut-2-enyl-diphosphate synthase
MYKRWQTKKIRIADKTIGGGAPVLVQSMTNTDTKNVKATVEQIKKLEDAGCEIVRVAVPDMQAAGKIGKIKKKINIPLVADIHFDYRIAVEAVRQGADKIRINPGNIGSKDKVKEVVKAAKKAGIPIRIGVNSGSIKEIHNAKTAKQRAGVLVRAALEHVKILESLKFFNIIAAIKASDVETTLESCRLFASKKNYPLHLGITESGTLFRGAIKSSVGLGILLNEGFGDTIRVSLTGDPVDEVHVAYQILQSLGLRSTGIDIVSCPTCARCEVNLPEIIEDFESKVKKLKLSSLFSRKPLKVAVMGCVVNGPGEAKESDIGIAGSRKKGILFIKGKLIRQVDPKGWASALIREIKKIGER